MTKLNTAQAEQLVGKEADKFDQADIDKINAFEKSLPDSMVATDVDAMIAASNAHLENGGDSAETQTPEIGDIHNRVQFLEGMLAHLCSKYFPNETRDYEAFLAMREQPRKLIDVSAVARG